MKLSSWLICDYSRKLRLYSVARRRKLKSSTMSPLGMMSVNVANVSAFSLLPIRMTNVLS